MTTPGKPDADLEIKLARLEEKIGAAAESLSEHDRDELGAEVSALRQAEGKKSRRLSVLVDASNDSWKPRRLLNLIHTLFPKNRGGREGSRIPEKWLCEMDRRCPKEKPTTVARSLIERSDILAKMVDPDARAQYLKSHADHVVKQWKERNRIP